MDTQEFAGRTVIVTGATRGIGRAICLAFLSQGAQVAGLFAGNTQAAQAMEEMGGRRLTSFRWTWLDFCRRSRSTGTLGGWEPAVWAEVGYSWGGTNGWGIPAGGSPGWGHWMAPREGTWGNPGVGNSAAGGNL